MPDESVSTRVIGGLGRSREGGRAAGGIDARVAGLVQRQQGVVARSQLIGLGFGEDAIDHRLACGRLHRLHRGVYAVGHRVIPKEGWWMAAVLASGPDAVLSHHTAAALWGLRGYSGGVVHVTVPKRSTSSKRIRRHLSSVPVDEREIRHDVPVTSVHRTIFDLATTEDADALISMLREAEHRNRYDRLSLWDCWSAIRENGAR